MLARICLWSASGSRSEFVLGPTCCRARTDPILIDNFEKRSTKIFSMQLLLQTAKISKIIGEVMRKKISSGTPG